MNAGHLSENNLFAPRLAGGGGVVKPFWFVRVFCCIFRFWFYIIAVQYNL